MADTLGTIAEEVLLNLQGSGIVNDAIVTLTSDVSPTDLTFTVDEGEPISSGLIEIDQEQMWVSSVVNGTVTIPPWGRGYRGTTASSHSLHSAVRIAPVWPRSVIYTAVNNVVLSLYPNVFAVKSVEFTADGAYYQYGLPVDVEEVLDVSAEWTKLTGWEPVTDWDVDYNANTTDFPTGKMLSLGSFLLPGMKVRVVYAARPTTMSLTSTPFSDTGLPASCKDLLTLGASLRLFPWVDIARIPSQSVEMDALAQAKPFGGAVTLARDFKSEYQRRIVEERTALNVKYGRRAHRIR